MDTASNADKPMSRLATLFAHSIPAIVVVSIAARLGYLFVDPALWALDFITSTLVVISVVALLLHVAFGGLCLRCMRLAPNDPQRAVTRNNWFLRVYHVATDRPGYVFVVSLSMAILLSFCSGLTEKLLRVALDSLFYSIMWSYYAHHKLRVWCPYCKNWGDGGDPEWVPDPDPAETMRR